MNRDLKTEDQCYSTTLARALRTPKLPFTLVITISVTLSKSVLLPASLSKMNELLIPKVPITDNGPMLHFIQGLLNFNPPLLEHNFLLQRSEFQIMGIIGNTAIFHQCFLLLIYLFMYLLPAYEITQPAVMLTNLNLNWRV